MKRKFVAIKSFCGALILAIGGQASADTTWTLGPTPPSGLSITGYANTGTGSSVDSQLIQSQPTGTNTRWYNGGWGINNLDGCSSGSSCDVGDRASTAPEHAIDNQQRYEMLLLKFTGQAVKLSKVNVGYVSTDSDITVMAYKNNDVPILDGKTWNQLVGSGWAVVGNYAGTSTSTGERAINSGGTYSSSYWLIGAYNPLAAGSSGFSEYNDHVKLFAVTSLTPTTPSQVSEPGSMALISLGLLGMWAGYKRRKSSLH